MTSKKPALSPLSEFASLSAGTTALGEIVVFIDGRVDAAGILEFASALAKEHDARLIGVFMEPAPEATPAQTFARGKGSPASSKSSKRSWKRLPRSTTPNSRTSYVVTESGQNGSRCPT